MKRFAALLALVCMALCLAFPAMGEEIVPCRVTYHSGEYMFENGENIEVKEYEAGTSILFFDTPKPVVSAAYELQCWCTKNDDSDELTPYDFAKPFPGGELHLYAQYQRARCNVTLYVNDGTSDTYGAYADTIRYDDQVNILPFNRTRQHYTFTGWNTKADGTGTAYPAGGTFTIKGNTNLYAQWAPVNYTVTFMPNGGTGTMAPQSFTYNVPQALTANAFTRDTFAFNGWNLKADGSGNAYNDKQSLTPQGDLVVYAQWKDIAKPVISGVEDNATYCQPRTVTVTDNVGVTLVTLDGKPIVLKGDSFTLAAAPKAQAIIAQDAAGNTAGPVTVTVTGKHTPEHVPTTPPSTEAGGTREHWRCTTCGGLFQDEGCTKPTTLQELRIPAVPIMLDGDGQRVTKGDGQSLTFRSSGDFIDFQRVEVDDKPIAKEHFVVVSGSTVVTLKADYLAELSIGKHQVGIASANGTATATFYVDPAPTDVPRTGDDAPLALWLGLLAGGAVAALMLRKRRFQ